MSQACQEIISINKTLLRLTKKSFLPALLRCDNRATICCAKTSGGNRLRHMIEDKDDYVEECVKYERIVLDWVSTKLQWADIMTKPLCFETHAKITNQLLKSE